MYRKVLAIIKEINDKTMNPKAAQVTLDMIAQEALKHGDTESKALADLVFALIPLLDEKKGEILSNLETLAFSLAKPTIEHLEKKLCKRYGYDFEEIETLRDNGIITEHFTPDKNIVVWLREGWSESGFKMNVVAFMKTTGNGSEAKTVCMSGNTKISDIKAMVDMVLA